MGSEWVVARSTVSMQPPWSTATSMMTEPGFIFATMSSVTKVGALRAGDEDGADQQIGVARRPVRY